jgi:hypothetical protein
VVDHLAGSSPRFRARIRKAERAGSLPALAVAFGVLAKTAERPPSEVVLRDAEELARLLVNAFARLRGELNAARQRSGAALVAGALNGDHDG